MRSIVIAAFVAVCSYEAADPELTPRDTGAASDSATHDAAADVSTNDAVDAPACGSGVEMLTPFADDPSCKPNSGDYVPGSPDDGWPMCISDDNVYHRFAASISTITRVDAFDRIAAKLSFGGDRAPTPADFVDARLIFSEEQGLGSRVERREDEHYPAAPAACNTMTKEQVAMYADRCAGPAKILPLINAAFSEGSKGVDARANADRVEAALLWFLYLSPYKEARTCTNKVEDCDSSYAYYTGGEPREAEGKGFARYVRARSRQTHDAIWNGILAVRCWRDLDNPTGAAMNLALRDRAVSQLDRAMNKGLAVIVRQRVARRLCASSWVGTRVLGGVLDREATARDPMRAEVLRREFAKADPASVDEAALIGALDAVFPCAY